MGASLSRPSSFSPAESFDAATPSLVVQKLPSSMRTWRVLNVRRKIGAAFTRTPLATTDNTVVSIPREGRPLLDADLQDTGRGNNLRNSACQTGTTYQLPMELWDRVLTLLSDSDLVSAAAVSW
ncbi:hypothetical protein B0H16DRAFT_1465280 [Mycena metata]|uniref:F-box domain-containing protein n=1 Tax=Mycena metata TaxID=1033252 RepID=A0AAD7IDY7_9AGAR|nr:hypothetical protein B0H16DRAFT_1465280 [Mycena metata]